MKILKSVTIAASTLGLTLSLGTSAWAADMTLKLGHLANEENAWHLAAVRFGEELSTRTDGRIAVEV
ncbi:MAG: hypothetical protein AB8B63_18910, partial [Granulosicoccus sp.]